MESANKWMKPAILLITFSVLLYLGVRNLDTLLQYVSGIWTMLFPFILGGAIAFVLNVPMKFTEKHFFPNASQKAEKHLKKIRRPVSLLISILFVILILMIVILVVAPELANTFISITQQVKRKLPLIRHWARHTFQADSPIIEWLNSIDIKPQKMLDSVINILKNGADNLLSSTVSVTIGIVSTTMNIFIALIFACYILLQKEHLIYQIKKAMYAIFPQNIVESCIHVGKITNHIFANFITGQCIEAVILGSMFFIIMTILRFPYALLVGVLIAFTAIIPMFGAFIGCFISFFLLLVVSPTKAVLFLIIFLVLQQIEGNLIYPHVVGNSVGLPSIWVLVAVTVGGSLMGVLGMLIFIPLVSILYTLFREWANKQLQKKNIQI